MSSQTLKDLPTQPAEKPLYLKEHLICALVLLQAVNTGVGIFKGSFLKGLQGSQHFSLCQSDNSLHTVHTPGSDYLGDLA